MCHTILPLLSRTRHRIELISGFEDERPRCLDLRPHQSVPLVSSGKSYSIPSRTPNLLPLLTVWPSQPLSAFAPLRQLMIRWCGKGGFADRKCTLDDTLDRWFDNRFPPLSIYHGGRDYLVLAEPLIERMKTKEKDVNVIKVTKLDLSEVCPSSFCSSIIPPRPFHYINHIPPFSLCSLALRARSLTSSTAISTGQQKL
jgi:hypothetical protein